MARLASTAALVTMLSSLLALPGCVEAEIEDDADAAFIDGKADGGTAEGSPEALAALAYVNDATSTPSALKSAAHVSSRVANNIVNHRNGADGVFGTADDDKFDTLAELDQVPYVGPATLSALIEAAKDKGFLHAGPKLGVIFSPQPAAVSSNAAIAERIRGAQTSVDIAIYSYSDAAIASALADAVSRGVKVRFLFETASADRKITDPAGLAASKSGRLEAMGVDVRWVNQILHHKFLIVDGPRDDKSKAATAKVVMGSANWSSTGSTVFDENTITIEGSAEIAAAYQHEFDILWAGSRELAGGATVQAKSTANILPTQVQDDAGIEAVFTSANFTPSGADGSTWRVDKNKMTMSDVWVNAIRGAQTSIHIASTHLRMRPVVEALIAAKAAKPNLDIEVYLDQQEWISTSGDRAQAMETDACVAAATTDTQHRDCLYNDYLFSKMVNDGGIPIRFKAYAYRWDATYAVQQHSKYMVVDGKELLSGSYNLSMNSEHGTFENALHITGAQFKPLVGQFETNFASMWDTGRAQGLLGTLRDKIAHDATIPLFFDNMSLTWSEFDSLRTLIRQNCTAADSQEFRDNPAAHKTCAR